VVAQFLGLKLRLLANIFRRSPSQVVGVLLGLIYGAGAATLSAVTLVALRLVEPALAGAIAVAIGSALVLGFLLVPFAFGADDPLDPRAFSLFGLPTTTLATGLALSGLLGVPAFAITAIAISQVVTWARSPFPFVLSVLGAVVIIATCVLAARVSTSLAAFLLATRRAREFTGLIALAATVSLAPVIALLATVNWDRDGLRVLSSVSSFAGWTPVGAAWSAPAEAASGHAGAAVAKMLIAIVFVGLLMLAWRGLVGWMIVAPQREVRTKDHAGLGWFDRMPGTPTGAVAARSITYWVRDPRYRTALIAIPIAPLVFVVAFSVAGVPSNLLALVPVPVMCLFLAWSTHNDVAYDSSAVWLHLASNTSGRADRFGRLVPVLLIGIPLVLIGSPICAQLYGDGSVLPSLIGVSSSLLLSGLGISSVVSARYPYPSVLPGDSPFAQPQASGTAAGLIQSFAFVAALVASLPAIGLAILGLRDGGLWPLASLVVGLGLGLAFLALGVVWGGRIYTRRAPELLAFTLRN
jgi:ABC-2 type transport system permease protein